MSFTTTQTNNMQSNTFKETHLHLEINNSTARKIMMPKTFVTTKINPYWTVRIPLMETITKRENKPSSSIAPDNWRNLKIHKLMKKTKIMTIKTLMCFQMIISPIPLINTNRVRKVKMFSSFIKMEKKLMTNHQTINGWFLLGNKMTTK